MYSHIQIPKKVTNAIRVAGMAAALAGSLSLMSCGGSSAPSLAAACQTNNTAGITFTNSSATNLTYAVVWDGSTIVTLNPGTTSSSFDVTAGVNHTLQFENAANNAPVCSLGYPNLTQCTTNNYSCNK